MAQPADPSNVKDFSTFKIISERNIFDPNRRPHVTAGPAVKIVDSFSLAGTIIYGKGQFAVFDGTGPDYRKVLEPGGTIAGYAVTNIGLDCVKLSSGTNQAEMKVGMQMRRDEDGQWSVGEQTERSGGTSYAGGSPRRHGGRRSSDSSSRRTTSPTASSPAVAPENSPQMTDAAEPGQEPEFEGTNAPPDTPGDLNDPVARLMRRRAQELNGNDNRTPNQ